jgi:Asp-tRNA(Asn)/Glu-tRNA(Gln) amidotransferase A subunit family amidase
LEKPADAGNKKSKHMPQSDSTEGGARSAQAGSGLKTSRREFLAEGLGLAACVAPAGAAAPSSSEPVGITPRTIEEAEKIHAVHFSPAQRKELAASVPAQAESVVKLRSVPRPITLQPAIHFDPRLPGERYPPQESVVRLASAGEMPLPHDNSDIAYAPVTHLSQWLRTGRLTSVRLTEIYLERIARVAPRLYCYITVTADLARSQARAMDAELKAGRYRGPLHGVPYSVKDVFDTAGIPTTWGCDLYRDRIPTEDATIVRKLRNAGAVLLGKAATGEIADGWDWFGGRCRNPWNLEEPSGGSSAGPASATAAGLCAFSIGTDSLGSILEPADRCGIVGLRATYGRVPVKGGMPLTPSLERIGPLARTVEDAALVLAAINGYDPTSASSIDMGFAYDAAVDLKSLRVGYSPQWFKRSAYSLTDMPRESDATDSVPVTAVEHAALEALKQLGVTLVPVTLPDLPNSALTVLLDVESAAVFEELTLSGQDEKLIVQSQPQSWREARLLSAVDYLQKERLRRQVMQGMHELFKTTDVLFGPTYGSYDLFMTANFTGHPGLTLRAGFVESPSRSSDDKFLAPADPHGPLHTVTRNVTFHGRLFEEGRMLAIGRALESKLGVWQRRPPIG